MRHRTCFVLLLASACFAAPPAEAAGPCRSAHGCQLVWENDAFAAFSGSDEHYTNGIRLSWLRDTNVRDNPLWTRRLAEKICSVDGLCAPSPPLVGYARAIGQNFYTPQDISVEQLQPNDRPYAGYLYYSWIVSARTDTHWDFHLSRPFQNVLELQVGFVGPPALGEEVQSAVHELIDDEDPMGWDNQLDFEPTVELVYTWRRKLGGSRFDLVPHATAGLGNVSVHGGLGATVRAGYNISDFPADQIKPTVAPVGIDRPEWEWYVFAGTEGRGVAHNIFLDGNTFEDSHSVDRDPWVYDLKAGFAVRHKAWRFDYTFVRRSDEFTPVVQDGEHDFGSFSVTYLAWP